MIFNSRSKYMLKYEKTKSKLVEFDVAEENYPLFQLNPDDLTYTTLFALSRYCEEMIENPSSAQIEELKAELATVTQYYDSTVKTFLRQEHAKLFLLLGATAYFLSENFGSAKVLISEITDWPLKSDVMSLLYATLCFLLNGKWKAIPTKNREYQRYLDSLKNHFEDGASPESIFVALRKMRDRIYQSPNVIAINYIDFLFSVAICAIAHSAWVLLPECSDGDRAQWEAYLSSPDSIKLLWPAQKIIIQAGALKGTDLVVPLPTGVGKTKSIELILRAKFMDRGNCISVVIAPLRALCNEITTDLTSAFMGEAVINQFTDVTQEDFDLKLLLNTKYVFICTPEKFSYILRHEPVFLASIQLFLFDEAHLFDDASRGSQYEMLVSEIARSRNEAAQMVLFSAVLSNANQISDWLFEDKKATINYSLVKSTEKSIGFLSSDQTIHYYEKDDMSIESFFVPKSITFTYLKLRGKETKQRIFPEVNARDFAIYYANKLCTHGGSAIYAGQVRSILPIMRRIVAINERGYNLSNLFTAGIPSEIAKLSDLFERHYGRDFELTQAAKLGAFPHYADLPNGMKMAIEHALRKKHISFVVCTTTLAEGVNIPIKYLFLTTFSLGTSNVQIRKMQNMVGRTARSGIHTEGSAIVTDFNFHDNRNKWQKSGKHKWADCKKMFDYSSTEACTSAILSLVSNLSLNYSVLYNAEFLAAHLIENYNKPLCFDDLANRVKEANKNHVTGDKRRDHYASEIDAKVKQLKHIMESIENYLCYVYYTYQNPEQFMGAVNTLVTQTFAYYLADEGQKQSLVKIFQMIANKITVAVLPEKAAYFARSLYGVDISGKVLVWVDENIDFLGKCSIDQLRDITAKLFVELFPDRVTVGIDIFNIVLNLWLSGLPYERIVNYCADYLKIHTAEKLCSNTLSYHYCFLIGNIIDAIGDRSEELIERLSFLQKKTKYGVPSQFQILVCENLFDDRIIAKQLDEMLGQVPVTEKSFRDYIIANKRIIAKAIESYPAYFSYKLQLFTMKKSK